MFDRFDDSMSNLATTPLFDHDAYAHNFSATVLEARDDLIALDRTMFYPSGGGQPGDSGLLHLKSGTARVVETFRDDANRAVIWHRVSTPSEAVDVGGAVDGAIDWEPRYENMRMHTCLHLLCSLISAPVTGCGMGGGKGRLDFDLPEMELTKDLITRRLNDLIEAGIEVTTSLVAPQKRAELLGLVRNRYALPPQTSDAIKIIDVQGIDVQPCGGTHVAKTTEIGRVVCEKIEKKGRQNRRVVLRFER